MTNNFPQATSIRTLCEAFWKLEGDEGLLRLQDNGVYFWRLIRFPLYYAATQKIGLFEAAHPSSSFRLATFMRRMRLVIKAFTVHGPFIFNRKVENIVMPHPRRIAGVDIYTQELLAKLPVENTLRLYNDYAAETGPGDVNMFACAFLTSLRRKTKNLFCRKRNFTEENYRVLERVHEKFKRELGIALPVHEIAELELAMFLGLREGYQALFKKTGARRLYLTSGYTNCAAIDAAQLCGMKVIEMQHGIFTRYHLGYSFPLGGQVPYTPDELKCFGKFWPETTPLAASLKITIIGAPYIKKLSAAYGGYEGVRKDIVFTSQGVIGAKLFDFALKTAVLLPHENFIFRLHPSELIDEYEKHTAGNIPPNLSLSHRKPNIFALLSAAKTQAGVFSTTLFEGMVLGCRTILIDLAGIEYMTPLVARGDAILVKTPTEFAAALSAAPLCSDPDFYYDGVVSLSI